MVQFQSKVRFEDKNEIDNNTNISAPDSTGMTTITQDDLKAMEARIYGRNKQDMNSATVPYTQLQAHETKANIVCRHLLANKNHN